ncbi:MAG TPA: hypothetical protein VJP05_07290 [Acidimicrobiia bacterium]|nr:hypothetical protein [Acidimicrobiia bacterium]
MQRVFPRRRRIAILCALVTVIGSAALLAAPAQAETVTRAELDAAAGAESQATAALDAARQRLAQATADRDRYRDSLARIASRRVAVAGDSADTGLTIRDRVARMYMVAGSGTVRLFVEDVAAFAARLAYLGAIAENDRQAVVDLAFSAADLAGLEQEATQQLAVEARRVADETSAVAARSSDLDAAHGRYVSVLGQWQRQEAARKAALEAELRAREAALLAASTTTTTAPNTPTTSVTSSSTTTTPGTATTTTKPDTSEWDPHGGVEQWRALVTKVFTEWGLDKEKCGPSGCVGPQIDNALVIMRCESSGIPFATNGPDTEWGVVGLFQHRRVYWSERVARARAKGFSALPADATPWNPEHNIIVAALLVWESRETLIGNLDFGRPWSDGPQPWGHWDGSSRYCAEPPLVTP